MEAIRDDVFGIVSTVLNVPLEQINEESSPQTLAQWDSLQHMNLILTLEEKFGVQFREDQIVNILNVRLIISAIKELKKEG